MKNTQKLFEQCDDILTRKFGLSEKNKQLLYSLPHVAEEPNKFYETVIANQENDVYISKTLVWVEQHQQYSSVYSEDYDDCDSLCKRLISKLKSLFIA